MREYRRCPVPGVHVRRAPQVYTPEEEMNNLQQAIDNLPDQEKAFFSSLLRQSGGQDLPPPPVLQPLVPHNDANIEPRTSQCMKRRAPGDDVARICDAETDCPAAAVNAVLDESVEASVTAELGNNPPPPPALQPLVLHNAVAQVYTLLDGQHRLAALHAMQESDSIPREYPSIPLTVRTGSIPEEIIAVKSTT